MFTLQPISVSAGYPAVTALLGDTRQQVFGFAAPTLEPHWTAEFTDTESGEVVQSCIFFDPFVALWHAAGLALRCLGFFSPEDDA